MSFTCAATDDSVLLGVRCVGLCDFMSQKRLQRARLFISIVCLHHSFCFSLSTPKDGCLLVLLGSKNCAQYLKSLLCRPQIAKASFAYRRELHALAVALRSTR